EAPLVDWVVVDVFRPHLPRAVPCAWVFHVPVVLGHSLLGDLVAVPKSSTRTAPWRTDAPTESGRDWRWRISGWPDRSAADCSRRMRDWLPTAPCSMPAGGPRSAPR